jgi:hypothetical protein
VPQSLSHVNFSSAQFRKQLFPFEKVKQLFLKKVYIDLDSNPKCLLPHMWIEDNNHNNRADAKTIT